MPMKPHKGESQSDFLGRCMSETFTGDRSQEQAVAICFNYWRDEHGGSKPSKSANEVARIIKLWCKIINKQLDPGDCPEPESDESHNDYIDRCIEDVVNQFADEEEDISDEELQSVCELAWEDYQESQDPTGGDQQEDAFAVPVHKMHVSEGSGFDYILSDASVDRFGDTIDPAGWDVRTFEKNPIALFNHNNDMPVGRWSNLRVNAGALQGRLELARAGTSPRIDEIRALVEQGILRAVSVGFRPVKHEPMGAGKGIKYQQQELLECSLVSVPANPNALQIARALKISDDTIKVVFGKNADEKPPAVTRQSDGKHAESHSSRRRTRMSTLSISKRVEEAQKRLVAAQDAINKHASEIDDTNVSDEDLALTQELNLDYDKKKKTYESLKEVEARLATAIIQSNDNGGDNQLPAVVQRISNGNGNGRWGNGESNLVVHHDRPFAIAGKKIVPSDYIFRALACAVQSAWTKGQVAPIDMIKRNYGEDEGTRALYGQMFMGTTMLTRAATVPASTTTPGWAADLVTTAWADFMDLLLPVAIYPQLKAKGGSFSFGANGVVAIPTRDATPTVSGAFVLQGAPIPVKQGSFSTITLTPKKMAVISVMTREASQHTTPALEGLIRDAILQDTGVALDAVLLDNNAATAVRPAGLLNGVTTTGASAATANLDKFVADVRNLINQLIGSSAGNLRSPVWLMSPGDVIAGQALGTTTGDLPFREELAGGTLFGIPIIQSTTIGTAVPDSIVLMDAADFVTASGDAPRFDVSDQAVVQMEDTNPLALIDGSSVPAPNTRSLWQTDSIGIRMIADINWAMRRAGMVKALATLGWN